MSSWEYFNKTKGKGKSKSKIIPVLN